MNGVHDMGGMHGFGPVERDELTFHHEWEKRQHALSALTRTAGLRNIDEGRHAIERMPPAAYLRATYYERWAAALETNMVENGVLTQAEIDARAAQFAADPSAAPTQRPNPQITARLHADRSNLLPVPDGPAPRFAAGDRVRARNVNPEGHTRLPRYARGKRATIDRVHGSHVLPDAHAHGRGPVPEPLYSVRFDAAELWGPQADGRGSVYLDLWESYLEEDT